MAFVKDETGTPDLASERALLGQALEHVQGMVTAMVDYTAKARGDAGDPTSIYKAGQHTTRLLLAMGDLVCAWLLLRKAEVALARLRDGSRDDGFYAGKVAAARWFCAEVLPRLAVERAIVERTTNDLMALPEDAF